MRVFTIALLLLNLGVAVWLIAVSSMELPRWQDAFDLTRDTLDQMSESSRGKAVPPSVRSVEVDLARSHLAATEAWTRSVIGEYRRSELALGLLTMGNIVGLAVLCFRGRRGTTKSAGVVAGK